MNKLDMAHGYAKIILERMLVGDTDTISYNEIASDAYQLADAMQAEADKREPKGFPEALLTKKTNGECAHFHTTLNRTECFDCGKVLKGTESSQLDWQPDWSVAPENMIYFAVDECGEGYFYNYKPYIKNGIDYWGDFNYDNLKGEAIPVSGSHYYQGDWKQSLRKRPQ